MAEINYTPNPAAEPRTSPGPSLAAAGGTQVYEGRSPSAPDDTTKPAIDFPTGGGTMLQWSVTAQAWV